MHLDKGNKMDEVLRQKFESYHSELDPNILSQVLEEVDKGDRANGLFLALSSFLFVILVMMGSNFTSRDLISKDIDYVISRDIALVEAEISSDIAPIGPRSSAEAVSFIEDDNSSNIEDILVKKEGEGHYKTFERGIEPSIISDVENGIKSKKQGNVDPNERAFSITISAPSLKEESEAAIPERTEIAHALVAIPARSWSVNRNTGMKNERSIETTPAQSFDPSVDYSMTRKWSAEFLIGPSLNYRTFEASESPDFTAHKNESDKSLLSANSEILIHYQPNAQWIFSLGIGRMNTGENYAFTLHEQTHEFKNEYHYLTIPVRTKFRVWEVSSGIDLYAGLGAQVGLLQEGTSSWVDLSTEQAVTHSNKGANSPFREELISGEADIMIRVALSKRLFISAQERGTYAFNSIYKNETGLDQHQFSFDSLFGIGVRF